LDVITLVCDMIIMKKNRNKWLYENYTFIWYSFRLFYI
jgi:hypothetical protein